MIIIGYQGIGKSSVAGRYNQRYGFNIIDLESGNFWNNGIRPDDWYIYYCNIAEHLSKQGNVVCVSSHEAVRNILKYSDEKVVIIIPCLELKDKWIERLNNRYLEIKSGKDYKALNNAIEMYEDNILDCMNSGIDFYVIGDTDYDLYDIIEGVYNLYL